jgi:hypothetical protein
LDSKRGKEENQKREEEQTNKTYRELVKFMRYELYHFSTCSWGLGIEKKEENLKKKQQKWGWIRDQISEKLTKKVNNFESINLA